MNGPAKQLIGLGLSLALLGLFVFTVDLGRLFDSLVSANYIFVVPAVGMYLLSILFRTVRWRHLLRHLRPVPVRRLYPVVVVGYMANNLLPLRLGELVRSYYVGEREGVSKTTALVTIFVERLLDALTLLFFIFAIAIFVPLTALAEGFGERYGVAWPLLVVALSLPFVTAFGLLLAIVYLPSNPRNVAATILRPLPSTISARLGPLVDLFLEGLKPLSSPGNLLLLFLMSIPVWAFEAALFMLIGYAFGLDEVYESWPMMVVAMVLVTSITNIGSSVPAAPGGVGLFELVARETLVLLPLAAVDRSIAGAYVAVVHAVILLPMILLGQVILWWHNISLGSLSRRGRELAATSSEAAKEPVSFGGGREGP